jgi:benzil reductase ((S)-benzoin forming)
MKQAFITGTSRGLGKAMAEMLLNDEWIVIGIGRTHTIEHENYKAIIADLSQAGIAENIALEINLNAERHLLINNAAVAGEIGYFGKVSNAQFQSGFQLNLISPAILINRFIELTNPIKSIRLILNISSGASQNAYDGWGMYCSSKAGIDSLTQVLIEELAMKNDFRTHIYSIAPGVIDTDMQGEIRKASKDEFSRIDKFISMHKQHHLTPAKTAARKLISYVVNDPPHRSGRVDVREFILT